MLSAVVACRYADAGIVHPVAGLRSLQLHHLEIILEDAVVAVANDSPPSVLGSFHFQHCAGVDRNTVRNFSVRLLPHVCKLSYVVVDIH